MITRFRHRAETEPEEHQDDSILSFQNFKPYPMGIWEYDWCVENWGTKWDACNPDLQIGEEELFYSFDTAWSPPTPVVEKMIQEYPSLSFALYYENQGCDFRGEFEGRDGNVTKDTGTEFHPECLLCGLRDYPSGECEYITEDYGFLCPKCYLKEFKCTDWDTEEN